MHTIVQILTPEGLEQWGEIDLIPPGAEVEHLRTINADGRIHDAELIPGKDSITLPALQVGDFVELEYLHGARGNSLVQRGFLGRGFLFGLVDIPIRHSLFRLAVPAGTDLVIDRIHGAPAAKRFAQDGFEVVEFEARDTPALAAEAHSPPLHEFAPLVQTGWDVTWRDLRDARRVELIEATRLTPELRRYAQAAAGTGSRDSRLRRIFAQVAADIRQVGDSSDFEQPASYILARREGNRLVLLVALLRALGETPRVLLARTLAHAQVDYRLPSQDSYSHGLVAIPGPGDGQPIWLDPAERFNPYGVLFPFLDGMPALEISGTDPEKVFARLPTGLGADQEKRIDLDLELHADGTLSGTGREAITTSQAVQYRQALLSMSQAQRRQAMEAGLGGYFSGSLLEDFELDGLDDPGRPLVIRYRFRAPAWAARRADSLVLNGGFYPYQLVQNLITGAERKNPLLITDLTRTNTSVTLRLPPGARVEPQEPVRWTGPASEFEMGIVQAGQQLRIDKRLTVRAGRIAPGDYPAFREFCRKVDARDTARIVIGLAGLAGS